MHKPLKSKIESLNKNAKKLIKEYEELCQLNTENFQCESLETAINRTGYVILSNDQSTIQKGQFSLWIVDKEALESSSSQEKQHFRDLYKRAQSEKLQNNL